MSKLYKPISQKYISADGILNGTTPITKWVLDISHPINSIYISTVSTNPSTLFGGTWESFAAGRVLVGVDASQTEFNTVLKTGGEATHTLTIEEMPSHTHNVSVFTRWYQGGWRWANGSYATSENVTSTATGGSQAHNNLQPYVTVYMFRRIS